MPRNQDPQHRWLVSALLALITIAVFLPVVWHGFIDYDDPEYVTENAHVQGGLKWKSVVWAFTAGHACNWHPLTWLSHMLDCQLYGLNPAGHHLTNLLFHAANTVLLFLLLRALTGACWRSAFVAALFALHPLRVESVAWVAERKDVLCGFFGLLALWAYERFAQGKSELRSLWSAVRGPWSFSQLPSSIFYLLSLFFFTCGLMSKPMLVTLPFVLLLLDYWPLQRLRASTIPRLVVEKAPFFLIAAVSSAVTFVVQQEGEAVSTLLTPGERVSNALVSYTRYLGKVFWPQDLAVFYPHPGQWPVWQVAASAALLLVVGVIVLRLARPQPYLAVGWLWFCGMLVPVIGLVQVGVQSMADRYSYLPSVGLFIMIAWGATELAAKCPKGRLALTAAAAAALAACALTTERQLRHWQNTESLFRHAIRVNRNSFVAWNNLGKSLAEQSQLRQAERCYRTAIEINPSSEEAWTNLGITLADLKRNDEAIAVYEAALRIDRGFVGVHNNLSKALAAAGRLEEAQAHCREAARLDPRSAEPLNNLGALLTREGKWDEAIAAFKQALVLDPGMSEARCGLGGALAKQGRYDEAVGELSGLLRLQPGNTAARLQLAGVLVTQGKIDQAVAEYSEVLRARPNDPDAHHRLALALMQQQDTAKAIAHYRAAIAARPNFADALNNLAWILATHPNPQFRDGKEALSLAERACRLPDRRQAPLVGTLGAACAEMGRFAEAAAAADEAIALAEKVNDKETADMNRKLADLYRSGQPYRDTP